MALANPSFGVLEAPGAERARDWLAARPDIDALVVQSELPDIPGGELVRSLVAARIAAASRTLVVTRSVDLRTVLNTLAGWFFARDARSAEVLLREVERRVS